MIITIKQTYNSNNFLIKNQLLILYFPFYRSWSLIHFLQRKDRPNYMRKLAELRFRFASGIMLQFNGFMALLNHIASKRFVVSNRLQHECLFSLIDLN